MSVCRDHQAREALGGKLCPHCYAEHTMDNLMKVRGRILRTCRTEMAMLVDAMDAHKKGKHYVTLDHIERVYAALERLRADVRAVRATHIVCDNYGHDGEAVAEYKS